MNDELTFEEQMIERGKSIMATDPKTGVFQQYSAHNVLAVHALRDGDEDGFRSHVRQMLDVVIGGFTDHGLPLHPEKQIPLLFLATAINEFERANRLAAIQPETKDSHSFDIALVASLRAALRGEPPPTYRYKPTKSELGLFFDIAAIGSDRFSTDGTDSYWRATRNRRYALTLFQERNHFSESLTQIHQRAEHVVGGNGG